jgi:hypothetical protein
MLILMVLVNLDEIKKAEVFGHKRQTNQRTLKNKCEAFRLLD